MRSSDCDNLIIPGLGGSGPVHWQTRWQEKLSTARRVEQADWDRPDRLRAQSRLRKPASRIRPSGQGPKPLSGFTCPDSPASTKAAPQE